MIVLLLVEEAGKNGVALGDHEPDVDSSDSLPEINSLGLDCDRLPRVSPPLEENLSSVDVLELFGFLRVGDFGSYEDRGLPRQSKH